MDVLEISAPNLVTYGSFREAVTNGATRVRHEKAKREWPILGASIVRAYSYSLNTARICFDTVSLDIIADGPVVNWALTKPDSQLADNCVNPCTLVHADDGNKKTLFDRKAVLNRI